MQTRLAVVVALFALCQAITEEETTFFGTTGMPESNTGIVGTVTVTDNGDTWLFESNGVPDHDTGAWPGINPNSIEPKSNSYDLPKNPTIANSPSCLPGGPIAMAVNGVMMFNPWNAFDENAVEGPTAEIFDQCDGHPDETGTYHYHKMPASCLFEDVGGEASPLVGVAFDGFAIYGPNDENGTRLTRDDLDECHGRYNSDGVYQYHTTTDFPYILGCYKGTPERRPPPGAKCYFASDADDDGNISDDDDDTTIPSTIRDDDENTTIASTISDDNDVTTIVSTTSSAYIVLPSSYLCIIIFFRQLLALRI